jgi:hypothetical protein
MHWFCVFEFKFTFKFICLLFFKKNRKPFFVLLLLSLYFRPLVLAQTVEVRSRPSYFSSAATHHPSGLARSRRRAAQPASLTAQPTRLCAAAACCHRHVGPGHHLLPLVVFEQDSVPPPDSALGTPHRRGRTPRDAPDPI